MNWNRPRNFMKHILFAAIVLITTVSLCGCQSGLLPDPNDLNSDGLIQPDNLRKILRAGSSSIYDRVARREITDVRAKAILAEFADELLSKVKVERIPVNKAWEYAEVFRAAHRWKEAEAALKIAVKYAQNEDRRVNDSLRLAQVMCQLGEIKAAFPIARSTFTAPPQDKAPILPSVLLEIAPATQGKGSDLDLARLLEDAIDQHRQVVVDPKSEAGQAFVEARPYLIRKAYFLASALYQHAGKKTDALRCQVASARLERPIKL